MKYQAILLLTFIASVGFSQNTDVPRLKKGRWVADLQLTDSDVLSFEMEIEKTKNSYQFYVVNGEEMIKMQEPTVINDSIHLHFPYFNSELVFAVNDKKNIKGYWQNFNKTNYTIDFDAQRSKKTARFGETKKKPESVCSRCLKG